jgi:Ser/Thr protein kinase RdoA (MazF antagonist)
VSKTIWGDDTHFFFDLNMDRVLDSVEKAGFKCTGRCFQLNSMENRVYDVELAFPMGQEPEQISQRFRVVKFYRPNRWTKEQILEEHEFLFDLQEEEIPVIAPERFPDGSTLKQVDGTNIYFTLFPKVGGRAPEEPGPNEISQLGHLIARLHNVGEKKKFKHRISLTPELYGRENLKYMLSSSVIPVELEQRYADVCNEVVDRSEKIFEGVKCQRVHGDCHFGNILLGNEGFFILDFDDNVNAPVVQDFWLIQSGRDIKGQEDFELFLEAYESMRSFDRSTLRLIEPLRSLRYIHYSTWIARRWEDPVFQKTFPHFKDYSYWTGQINDLYEQLEHIKALC